MYTLVDCLSRLIGAILKYHSEVEGISLKKKSLLALFSFFLYLMLEIIIFNFFLRFALVFMIKRNIYLVEYPADFSLSQFLVFFQIAPKNELSKYVNVYLCIHIKAFKHGQSERKEYKKCRIKTIRMLNIHTPEQEKKYKKYTQN